MGKSNIKSFLIPILLVLLPTGLTDCQFINELFEKEPFLIQIGSGLPSPEAVSTASQIYETPLPAFNPVQLFWFYKPPTNERDLPVIASNFSSAILTRNDEPQREFLRDLELQGPILQYLRFEVITDPGDCQSKPAQNQVAHLEGDFCQISTQYPNWFLLDINGNPIHYPNSSNFFMDPGSPGWREYFIEKVNRFQQDNGWDGLFLDNVDGSLNRFEDWGILLANYPSDAAYQQAIVGFLQEISRSDFHIAGKPIYANIPFLVDTGVWFEYLQHLDGAMLEAFAVGWENGYLSKEEWLSQMELAEHTQKLGKDIFLVAQGTVDDIERMRFGFASFLLINNGQAYFRYTNDDAYRTLWWYPEYDIHPGQPVGPRYERNGIWYRDFEHGKVMVDPTNHKSNIEIKE